MTRVTPEECRRLFADAAHEDGPDTPVETTPEVERTRAHFYKVSDELMTERCRSLEVALWKLANECDAMRAFESDIRAVVGNINWNVLRQRVDEARAILACIPEDIIRAHAFRAPRLEGT